MHNPPASYLGTTRQLAHRPIDGLFLASGHEHRRTVGDEGARDGEANPAGAARDDRHLAGKQHARLL
jgi:hypothetical protein